MKTTFLKILFAILCAMISQKSYSQQYTLQKLAKKTIVKTKTPTMLPNIKKQGDTIITTYVGGSTEILLYFVEGEQYDEIFNPNPSGLYLNKQYFTFYCDPDKTSRQSVTKIASIYEFLFLERSYLCIITLREQDTKSKYRCYNFFDITNSDKITQGSFPSIYVGEDSFGDFNGDNALDCITVINRKPETFKGKIANNAHTLRAYTFKPDNLKPLLNNSVKLPCFIYALFDDEKMGKFKILQADWFFPLRDSIGKIVKKTAYYKPTYSCGDYIVPLFNYERKKVEKNRYSVELGRFDLMEGLESMYKELMSKQIDTKYGGIYTQIDQYGTEIKWILLVGNYVAKEEAQKTIKELQKLGYQPLLKDLRSSY